MSTVSPKPEKAPKPAAKAALLWEFDYLKKLLANPRCCDSLLRVMVEQAVLHALDPVAAKLADDARYAEWKAAAAARTAAPE